MRTAEEILRERVYIAKDDTEDVHDSLSNVTEAMIKFAKIHVQAALIAASENTFIDCDDDNNIIVDKSSILNAYSLDLIK